MPRPKPETLPQRLRRLRASRGLTQAQLARAAGLTTTGYQYAERGERTPTLETRRKLARAFGVPLAELLVDMIE